MLVAKEELTKLLAKAPDVAGQIDPFNVNNILNNLDDGNIENGTTCSTFIGRSIRISMDFNDESEYFIA